MPGKVKVRILAGRNLPVMDRASDLTDAFVEVCHKQIFLKNSFLKIFLVTSKFKYLEYAITISTVSLNKNRKHNKLNLQIFSCEPFGLLNQ